MTSMTRISKASAFIIMTALLTNCAQSHVDSSAASAKSNETVAGIIQGRDAQPVDVAPGGVLNSVVAIYSVISKTVDPTTHQTWVKAATCSGTLIAPDMVLTAAHCTEGITANQMSVYVQALTMGSGTKIAVKKFLANPDFVKDSTDMKDDFAVLQLASSAPATATPISLGASTLPIGPYSMLAAGYGQSDDRHNTPSNRTGAGILRSTVVQDGATVFDASAGPNQVGLIVADSHLTGTCFGDSGGPLFAIDPTSKKFYIVGVTHGGPPSYQGQEQTDWDSMVLQNPALKDAASVQKAEDAFYAKYPDAHTCSGIDMYANVTTHVTWIQQAMTSLRSQN